MVVGHCLVDIRLFGTNSLKDKRRVLKSLTTRLCRNFGLSCAEVGANDSWGRAFLGLAVVSNRVDHAERVLQKAVSWIQNNIDGEVLDCQIDIIT